MKGKLAAAALAAGLLVAGCGGDGGDGSTEAICEEMNQIVDPLETDLNAGLQAAGMAAATGDEATLEEAAAELDRVIGEVTTAVRDGAERADDDAFGDTLREFADQLEAMIQSVVAGEMPDTSALVTVTDELEQYCGTGSDVSTPAPAGS